jgi:transcriptional regulator with XRE-family HTH domain
MTAARVLPGALRAARLARGWSVDQLADALRDTGGMLGIRVTNFTQLRTMVANWEERGYAPSERYVYLLSEVYGAADPAELGIVIKDPRRYRSLVAAWTHGARQPAASGTAAGPARNWRAMPLGAVLAAARAGDEDASDALLFASSHARWGAAR